MKYAIIKENGATEIREDMYPLQENAIALTDEQHAQLISGKYILKNNKIVVNPNAKTLGI
jgi:hypothetical protein